MIRGTESVVLLGASRRDAYGDPLPGSPDEVVVEDVLVQPGASPEHASRLREGVVVDLTLHLPAGSPPVHRDQRVRVRGRVYEVDEEPAVWSGGDLAPGAVVVSLRRGEG